MKADQVTDQVTGEVTDQVTWEVTDQVTGEVTNQATLQVTPQVTPHVAPQVTPHVRQLLSVCEIELNREARMVLADREHFRIQYLRPAIDQGLIEMTIPDKPRSSKQRYRLTDAGRNWLSQHGGSQ